MIGPSIEPSDVGWSGLLWLFLSYGYVLYAASNLISEGSELLLLVPSMAGLVGGVVLPFLGAVPDGAIILFSGLGEKEEAQETLSVGVGALAGSTIMLLTISFGLSIIEGRVDFLKGQPNYLGKPKLSNNSSLKAQLLETGVTVSDAVQRGACVMMLTTIPYFLIQVPAAFLHGENEEVAAGERWWSLTAVLVCLAGLVYYMRLQLKMSSQGQDKGRRMAVTKKLLQQGAVSLSGAVAANVALLSGQTEAEYQSLEDDDAKTALCLPADITDYLKELLKDSFLSYDENRDGKLDRNETYVFFRDYHESISEEEMGRLFTKYDRDSSGSIDFDEFIGLAYSIIKTQDARTHTAVDSAHRTLAASALSTGADEEEQEEIPEEFTDLPPDKQQAAIKKRAFFMLTVGTALVVLFSDPMVDVMQEIAIRSNISPFYISFILAPLASNASEIIASMYYAAKKTRKTITVSLSALEGAACMNNTFCLSIFMFLVFFRGLAWQYTAETIAIVITQLVVGLIALRSKAINTMTAIGILLLFPASIALVAILEALGFD